MIETILGLALIAVGSVSLVAHAIATGRRAAAQEGAEERAGSPNTRPVAPAPERARPGRHR